MLIPLQNKNDLHRLLFEHLDQHSNTGSANGVSLGAGLSVSNQLQIGRGKFPCSGNFFFSKYHLSFYNSIVPRSAGNALDLTLI